MKEKFIKRKLTGSINVTCKFDDGTKRVWSEFKAVIVQHIVDVVDEYRRMGHRLSLRQLYYQLVTKNYIINHDSCYQKLGRILDDCRYAGIIDWDAIEDRGRVPRLPYSVDSVNDAFKDTYEQYRRNRQEGQKVCVELWTEKDALSGIFAIPANRYHVRLCVNKGYTSSSAIYDAYKRVCGNIFRGKDKEYNRTVILYFGDHDPSGLDMVRDIRDRLHFMLLNGKHGDSFKKTATEKTSAEDLAAFLCEVKAIGLTRKQVRQYNLPPNPTKITDPRAEWYISKFGKTCWEVDALRPDVLMTLVQTNIEKVIDTDIYNGMLKKESSERETVRRIAAEHGFDFTPIEDEDEDEGEEENYDDKDEDE